MFDRLVKEQSVYPIRSSDLLNVLQHNLVGGHLFFLGHCRLWYRLLLGLLFLLNDLSINFLFVPEARCVFRVDFLEEILAFGFRLLLG